MQLAYASTNFGTGLFNVRSGGRSRGEISAFQLEEGLAGVAIACHNNGV